MTTPAPTQTLTWLQAVDAAQRGHVLRRRSDMWTRVLQAGNPSLQDEGGHWSDDLAHAPVIESGQEGFRLVAAWTHDNKPVTVFQGAGSKCLFVPDSDHLAATDWVIET